LIPGVELRKSKTRFNPFCKLAGILEARVPTTYEVLPENAFLYSNGLFPVIILKWRLKLEQLLKPLS
jgi:hypothetical protein